MTIKIKSVATLASQTLAHTHIPASIIEVALHFTIYLPSKYRNNCKMLAALTSLSLVLASATLLQLCNALNFGDNGVAYLTNCQTSDTGAGYSEASLYLDVTQSFNGQNPDAYEDTSLGQITTWEGVEVQWSTPAEILTRRIHLPSSSMPMLKIRPCLPSVRLAAVGILNYFRAEHAPCSSTATRTTQGFCTRPVIILAVQFITVELLTTIVHYRR